MDRRRLLSELVRVLAPGGTLAFSDSARGILRYPGLSARLRQEITAFNVPEDPEGYYREVLSELGAEALSVRLHFGGGLAAMTQSVMYDWPPDASRRRYCDLIRTDPAFRAIHRDRLTGIATLTKAEWECERGPEDGWNVHVSCRKPGLLELHRPVPSPRCVWCHSGDIERTLETCRCASCGHRYTSRFGRAYLMKGNDAGYCPKPADRYAPGWDERLQARITRALDALCRESDSWLRSDAPMTLVGVDPSTEFTVRYLRSRGGPHLDAVCSLDDACAGQSIAGLPIIGGAELGQRKNAVLLSGLGSKAHAALAGRLRERGFSGRVLAIDDERIREYDEGPARHGSPRVQLTT
jgi:hypothetical protein